MYCTADDARARGAVGDDTLVEAAIAAAMERIDTFTGDHFEPVTEARTLRVHGAWATTRRRLTAVTAITWTWNGEEQTVPAEAYQVTPFGIQFRTWGYDVLVAGAEPWRGGWANLIGDIAGQYVEVTGTWGWPETPSAVAEACALLAADVSPGVFVPASNAEGDPVGVPPADRDALRDPAPERVAPAARLERTTGNAEADRLLAGYVSGPYKFG